MIRVLIYILLLALLAYGGMLIVQDPGHVTLTWHNEVIKAPAAALVGAIALAAIILWCLFRFVFGLPSFVRFAARQRRREKGYVALSRGLIAVGSGDGRTAGRAASQADRHLKNDPLAIMLRAQAAHMNKEAHAASAAFEQLAQRDDTRVLGLRGLHADAVRRGDEDAARHFADAAHRAAPLPWSAQAVLEHRASDGDWERALATVESSLAARLIDKETGERQRAVLETAIAYDKEQAAPEAALTLARAAMKRAPDLAPAIVIVARLLTRRGAIRKASKIIERAWPRCQHPDVAQAYLDVRPGDSTQDRLARAKTLMGIASFDPVSRTTVARAALGNKDFATSRDAMAPLIAEGKHPTVRQCMLMAELEEAEHGDMGLWREWLARASRAPLDPAWIADGIVYDYWAPASPTTGRLDAFQWQVPAERLGPAMDSMPVPQRRETSLPPPPAALVHHDVETGTPQEETSPAPSSIASPQEKTQVEPPPVAPPVPPPASQYAAAGLSDTNVRAAVGAALPETRPSADDTPGRSAHTEATERVDPHAFGDQESVPRITLPPETVAEQRNPEVERSLFHRRLAAESEAQAERADKVRSANGATSLSGWWITT